MNIVRALLATFALSVLFVSSPVSAIETGCNKENDPLGFGCVEDAGYQYKDPRIIVGEAIRIVLRLTGVLLIGLVLYAGYLYMTSQGDSGETEKAITVLRVAIIGLFIVLSAYSITIFVFKSVLPATSNKTFIAP